MLRIASNASERTTYGVTPSIAGQDLCMGRLVTTSEAAKELGVGTSTLQRWAKDKVVSPDLVTPGGHMRWDVDNLRGQLRELRQRDE